MWLYLSEPDTSTSDFSRVVLSKSHVNSLMGSSLNAHNKDNHQKLNSTVTPKFQDIIKSPSMLFAFGFGSGLSKWAPGTVGTLAAVPFYWLMSDFPLFLFLGVVLVASILGVWICQAASDAMAVHDHPGIVWDEFVGYWITMIAAPSGWFWIVFGFVMFRIFDILKPWPISWLDRRVSGGLGIMIDDILAGIFAFAVVQIAAAYWG